MAETNRTVDLKAIRKAEQFLLENCLLSTFYLFCNEMRELGIKERWNHEKRWNAIAEWVCKQDLTFVNPFAEKPQGIEAALTEWYEKIYLPSKWTSNSSYKRYNKKSEDQRAGEKATE